MNIEIKSESKIQSTVIVATDTREQQDAWYMYYVSWFKLAKDKGDK